LYEDINDKTGRKGEKEILEYFEVLFRQLLGRIEERTDVGSFRHLFIAGLTISF
jgi:hypothetical protein